MATLVLCDGIRLQYYTFCILLALQIAILYFLYTVSTKKKKNTVVQPCLNKTTLYCDRNFFPSQRCFNIKMPYFLYNARGIFELIITLYSVKVVFVDLIFS